MNRLESPLVVSVVAVVKGIVRRYQLPSQQRRKYPSQIAHTKSNLALKQRGRQQPRDPVLIGHFSACSALDSNHGGTLILEPMFTGLITCQLISRTGIRALTFRGNSRTNIQSVVTRESICVLSKGLLPFHQRSRARRGRQILKQQERQVQRGLEIRILY